MNISYSFLQVVKEKFSYEGLFRGYAHGRVRTFFRAAGWYKYVRYILWLGLFSGRSAETRETEKNRKRRDFDDL